jgi:mono/diheme cytochrome c family protein
VASRRVRLIVIPAILFLLVSGTVFALAELHPAKADETPSAPSARAGPAQRGQQVFEDNCASCHETGVGPELAGSGISVEAAREQIVNGGGGMPANLVQGEDLEDVLAYLETIL